jgi:hypothetical protein
MSIDYEVRFDDACSRQASLVAVRHLLVDVHGARVLSDNELLYDRDKCWIEITLIQPASSEDPAPVVNAVGFRIPAAGRLGSANRAIEIGFDLAGRLGWGLFDPQSDRYVTADDLAPPPPLRESLARLGAEVSALSADSLARRLWRRTRRQSLRSLGEISFGGVGVAILAAWLFGFRPERNPTLTLAIVASVTVLVALLDIVADVLGEVHSTATHSPKDDPGQEDEARIGDA